MPQSQSVSTKAKTFGEFPLSIRIAQRSIVLAIVIPIVLRAFLRAKGQGAFPWLTIAIATVSGACALVGFLATYYAVIRYPYMGLVDAVDGDLFSKYVESQKKWARVAATLLCCIVAIVGVFGPMSDGRVVGTEWLVVLYSASLLLFVCFLLFYYNPVDHPTVATFLRCSMGLGIFIYPLFLPALVLGSMRVDRLLDEATVKIEYEKRHSPPGR